MNYKSVNEQVTEFHIAFEQPVKITPEIGDENLAKLRAKLILEEAFETVEKGLGFRFSSSFKAELKETLDTGPSHPVDLIEFSDGCGDLDYVVEGSRISYGIDGAPIAAEIHRSNMAKLHNGKVVKNEYGKVVKPDNWTPPDIKNELIKQGLVIHNVNIKDLCEKI